MAEKNKLKDNFFVIVLLCILTVFLTYPVIFQITTHIAGDGSDGWQNIWNMWWVKKAMTENINIYFTDYQFYPSGESLAFHTLTLYNSLLSVPLQMVFGNIILVYNILFLSSFVLAGYGMFLLIKYLVCNKGIAVVSGIAYAFSPYHFAQALGHLNLLTIQWVPFYILFLFRTFREKNNKNPVLAGVFLLLTSIASWQYMVYLLIFTVLYLAYLALSERQKIFNKPFLKRFGLFIVVFAALVLPFAYPMMNEFLSSNYMKSSCSNSFSFISPGSYILPSPLHPLFGKYIMPVYPINLSDSIVFLGYGIILISAYFLIDNFKKVKFWLFSAFLFFILSLNPNGAFSGLLMPVHAAFRMLFPFFSVINNMERFALMVLVSVIVIFSYALSDILPRLKKFNKNAPFLTPGIFLILVSVIIIFEFCPVPYYTTDAGVPAILGEMGKDGGNYTVLDIPPVSNSRALYFQTVHGKKILGGYISRTPPSSLEHLKQLQNELDSNDTKGVFDIVKEDNIRFVILYKSQSNQGGIDLRNILNLIPLTKAYENEEIAIYKTGAV
ncbi:MAG: hypothetical protein KKB25_02095 [Nanoarchaeota archaeon]|nr:hypothetical protein [Nanoarchaeota archaeon]